MKIMSIFGTRPEIIRLSLILRKLEDRCDLVTVHTGQNYAESLSDIFMRDLCVRPPDEHFGIRAKSFGEQVGQILEKTEAAIEKHAPDRILILGDTNSALSSIVAARRGIPVFHMEAGNRCYDERVPEEVNRRIIDHSSAVLLPYTERSKENLVAEGIERERIYVTGNPIGEVLGHFAEEIGASDVLQRLSVGPQDYFLATLHRAENVDLPERLSRIFEGFGAICEEHSKKLLVSVHPRTREKLENYGVNPVSERIELLEPLGFFDFVKLEQNALAVLSDSGTVQEECAIYRVPNVTVRDVTERPETIECGSNILAGSDPEDLRRCLRTALECGRVWDPPAEYLSENVSATVSKIVLGYHSRRVHR